MHDYIRFTESFTINFIQIETRMYSIVRFDLSLCQAYKGDPRSNANPSVISFKFAIIKNGLPVYYDILSIL